VSTATSTWTDAATVCTDLGATLATVEDADADAIIFAMMTDDTWIGLNDKTTEGSFEWIADGSALGSYTNWYNSPTNPGTSTTQSCVIKKIKQSGEWDDVGCNKDLAYACSMEAVQACG